MILVKTKNILKCTQRKENNGKFLSADLLVRDEKGRFTKESKRGVGYWKGKKRPNLFSPESIEKMRESHRGDKAYNYKGRYVSNVGLHQWISRWLGKPTKCSLCGSENERRYEWSNISGEYKREISDWRRLCKKCHYKVDDVGRKMWETRRKRTYSTFVPVNKGIHVVHEKQCVFCGVTFDANKKSRLFCSNSCSMKYKWGTGILKKKGRYGKS